MADNGAGKLRHLITIRRQTKGKDGLGGFTSRWDTIGTPRARVLGIPGREATIAQALQGISVFSIRIRYRPGLLQTDQIVLKNGTELNIKAITPDELGRWLDILADNESVKKDQ